MDRIQQILANSPYEIDAFSGSQQQVFNEMFDNGISAEQISIIANPSLDDLTYSVIFDYLDSGKTITLAEFSKYFNVDSDHANELIVNVYLGKLHGLDDKEIDIFANSRRPYKLHRLFVEKAKKDRLSKKTINELINGDFGRDSLYGKLAIQEYLQNEIRYIQLQALRNFGKISQREYDYIKTAKDEQLKIMCFLEGKDLNKWFTVLKIVDEPEGFYDYDPCDETTIDAAIKNNAKSKSIATLKTIVDNIECVEHEDAVADCFFKVHQKLTKSLANCLESAPDYIKYVLFTDDNKNVYVNRPLKAWYDYATNPDKYEKISLDSFETFMKQGKSTIMDDVYFGALFANVDAFIKKILTKNFEDSRYFKVEDRDDEIVINIVDRNRNVVVPKAYFFEREIGPAEVWTYRFTAPVGGFSATQEKEIKTKQDIVKSLRISAASLGMEDTYKEAYESLHSIIDSLARVAV